ncbi:hypothetical protein [Streptomyces sp. ZL-24]|uniref:hypothetical protein n=1 Tax=Streptomyces sp. ZL-24 TaxID=1933029 RepID=UPI0011B0C0AF|nr:hypothetical protein [Streptomyces sp. ZL-24]
MKKRVRRSMITLTTAVMMSAAGVVSTASPAVAAPQVSFGSPGEQADGSRYISIGIDGARAGFVLWAANPDSTEWSDKGDTLIVRDSRTDGMAISANVVQAGSGSTYLLSASTSGLKAPALVKRTKNAPEGKKLLVRPCVTKGSSIVACGPYYSIHA